MEVLVRKATILREVEALGTMDPYVVIYLGKSKAQTNVAKDQGKNPVWNQNLKLQRAKEEILRFEIIDFNDILKSKLIGYGSVSLFQDIHNQAKRELNTPLFYKGTKIGSIYLDIQFFK